MENIQLLHQELNARGDEQVGEVVAVDLKKKSSHCWNVISAKESLLEFQICKKSITLIDCFDQIRFTNKHLELELN